MEKDLKWIKKHYGEEMAHLCRSLFPKVLENEWVLPKILYDHFPNNRSLGSDIVNQNRVREFQDYISSFINVETKNRYIDSNLTAKELLDKAGYILYPECKSEKDIQFFRKYYKKGELLCTFWTDRLKDARVWFAVKKDVDKIKREDFKEPKRQDEYGTSVISIQFSKYNYLSIKNRYNHTVNNPDNTFNSDLDNIIPGLADAFERDYGVRDAVQNRALFELIGYVLADGKYYKYNHEINEIYYCDDNVIIQNYRVKKLPQHKMLVDYFVFDFKNNTVQLIDNRIKDSFINCLDKIKKITHENGIIDIERENGTHVKIGINQNREIVSLQDCSLKKCKNDFLLYNKAIEKVDLPKLKNCGNSFLLNNLKLTTLSLPDLETCGSYFMHSNANLSELNLPKLTSCVHDFLFNNKNLKILNLENLKDCGNNFLSENRIIQEVNLPQLKSCGNFFLDWNKSLKALNLSNLKRCGRRFLSENETIQELNLDNLTSCADAFLTRNQALKTLSLPNLRTCGHRFLCYNKSIRNLNLPLLESYGERFLWTNYSIKVSLAKLRLKKQNNKR